MLRKEGRLGILTADISYQVYEVIRYCGLSQEPYQSYPEVTKTHAELPTLAELKNLPKDAGLHVGVFVLKRMVVKSQSWRYYLSWLKQVSLVIPSGIFQPGIS